MPFSACSIQHQQMILKNFSATARWLLYKVIQNDQGLGECSKSSHFWGLEKKSGSAGKSDEGPTRSLI